MLYRTRRLGADQRVIARHRNPAGNLVLESEQFDGIVVETLRPYIRVGFRVDQLDIDTGTIARSPDAAAKNVADIEIAADLSSIDPFILVGESRVARDHGHTGDARQI